MLPVFEMIINPDELSDIEVSFVALVDKPAIEKNFLAFSAVKELNFAIDNEQRIISGPAMVADSLIFRKDEGGEYNVFFSKDTIKDIAVKFFKKGYEKNVNLFHDPNLKTEGVTIFESFVSDVQRGIQPMKGFEDLPDGSWFISAKVDNDEIWNKIKAGEVKGFSVEGIFSYMKIKLSGTKESDSHLKEISIMSEIKELWDAFKQKFIGEPVVPVQLMEYKLKDGTAISIDKLEAGGVVTVAGQQAAPGSYEFEDGTVIEVAEGGVIAEVKSPAIPEMSQTPDYSKQFASYDEKFTTYEQKFTEVSNTILSIKEQFAKQNEAIVSLMKVVEKIVETPTAEPTDRTGNQFNSNKDQTKLERRTELAKLLSNLKSK